MRSWKWLIVVLPLILIIAAVGGCGLLEENGGCPSDQTPTGDGSCCPHGSPYYYSGACHSVPYTGGGGGGGGGGTTPHCNSGDTYNFASGMCCPNSAPYYYPGTHGGQAGCYASCPYANDCGTQFQQY